MRTPWLPVVLALTACSTSSSAPPPEPGQGSPDLSGWTPDHPLEVPAPADCHFEVRWDLELDGEPDEITRGVTDAEGRWTSTTWSGSGGETEVTTRTFEGECVSRYSRRYTDADGATATWEYRYECDEWDNVVRAHLAYVSGDHEVGDFDEYVWAYALTIEDGRVVRSERSFYRGVEWAVPDEVTVSERTYDSEGRLERDVVTFEGEPYQTHEYSWTSGDQLSGHVRLWEQSGDRDTWEATYDDDGRQVGEQYALESEDAFYAVSRSYGSGWFWTGQTVTDEVAGTVSQASQVCTSGDSYVCSEAIDGSRLDGRVSGALDEAANARRVMVWSCPDGSGLATPASLDLRQLRPTRGLDSGGRLLESTVALGGL